MNLHRVISKSRVSPAWEISSRVGSNEKLIPIRMSKTLLFLATGDTPSILKATKLQPAEVVSRESKRSTEVHFEFDNYLRAAVARGQSTSQKRMDERICMLALRLHECAPSRLARPITVWTE
jgi:hypothetical protein